jgi:ABC-type uncharacterized transport system permease subunit
MIGAGSTQLDLRLGLDSSIGEVLQGQIVLFVILGGGIAWWWRQRRHRAAPDEEP